MATIHILRPTSELRQSAPRELAASAEIVLFPGVRYERWTEPKHAEAKSKKKRRSRVKRDRMTING